jgi:poly(3-hydroxybutyrate) depolymerase
MMYQMYQAQCDMMAPLRVMARFANTVLKHPATGLFEDFVSGNLGAAYELIARSGLSHSRPPFGIDRIEIDGSLVPVHEERVDVTPFATLLRFAKDVAAPQPRVLLVAPLSGHFATLLRGTIRTMLPEHDVYITDWHNARDVSLAAGSFDVDDYVDHVIRFLEVIGPGAHVVAVCQPCVPVLAAVAVMAEAENNAQPRSMTLMAGPIDTRVSPTKVNELAMSRPIEWFERNLIDRVPFRYSGAARRVYPGFVQLLAFMSMNIERHLKAHRALFDALVKNDRAGADATRAFYDEYFAVLDLPAEFYLQTVRTIFQEHALPLGRYEYRGRRVDLGAIRRTSLLTVEGEKDDICGLGQTLAAQELCTSLRPYRKSHHLQAGVGHFGVFNGSRWNNQIYPVVKNLILSSD